MVRAGAGLYAARHTPAARSTRSRCMLEAVPQPEFDDAPDSRADDLTRVRVWRVLRSNDRIGVVPVGTINEIEADGGEFNRSVCIEREALRQRQVMVLTAGPKQRRMCPRRIAGRE